MTAFGRIEIAQVDRFSDVAQRRVAAGRQIEKIARTGDHELVAPKLALHVSISERGAERVRETQAG